MLMLRFGFLFVLFNLPPSIFISQSWAIFSTHMHVCISFILSTYKSIFCRILGGACKFSELRPLLCVFRCVLGHLQLCTAVPIMGFMGDEGHGRRRQSYWVFCDSAHFLIKFPSWRFFLAKPNVLFGHLFFVINASKFGKSDPINDPSLVLSRVVLLCWLFFCFPPKLFWNGLAVFLYVFRIYVSVIDIWTAGMDAWWLEPLQFWWPS